MLSCWVQPGVVSGSNLTIVSKRAWCAWHAKRSLAQDTANQEPWTLSIKISQHDLYDPESTFRNANYTNSSHSTWRLTHSFSTFCAWRKRKKPSCMTVVGNWETHAQECLRLFEELCKITETNVKLLCLRFRQIPRIAQLKYLLRWYCLHHRPCQNILEFVILGYLRMNCAEPSISYRHRTIERSGIPLTYETNLIMPSEAWSQGQVQTVTCEELSSTDILTYIIDISIDSACEMWEHGEPGAGEMKSPRMRKTRKKISSKCLFAT